MTDNVLMGMLNPTHSLTHSLALWCHVAEEFNNRLLTPELSESQLMDLHRQLSDLYRMYIDPDSLDCVRLDDDIILQLKTGMSVCLVEHCVHNYGVNCILCITDNVCVTEIHVYHLL